MIRNFVFLRFGAIVLSMVSARASDVLPLSPSDMTSALERRVVSGEGVMYPGEDSASRTNPQLALLDESWPDAFLARIGETVSVRVSTLTGCYEFSDEDGTVFWIEIPVAPLTWNWTAPFLRPFAGPGDDPSILSPWHFADRWTLSTKELESFRTVPPLRRATPLRSAPDPNAVTHLCFTAFRFTATNQYFSAAWPTNDTLPGNVLDLYCSTSRLDRFPFLLSSHPATNPPVLFDIPSALVPNWGCATSHVHDATCPVVTNIVLSPLDGTTIYTNVVYGCAVTNSPTEAAFFRLGSRIDTDGDGLADAYELYVTGTRTNAVDTDLDGLSDGEEPTLGTDPLDPDTDGDGLFDFEEVRSLGTDPCNPDTDGDGLLDAEETGYCHRTESFEWFAPHSGTNLLAGLSAVLDDAVWEIPLSFPLVVGGVTNDRVAIDLNGLVHLLAPGETSVVSSLWSPHPLSTWTEAPAHVTVASAWADYVADGASGLFVRQLPDEGIVAVSFWALLPRELHLAGLGTGFSPRFASGDRGNARYMCALLNIRNDPPDTVDLRLAIIPDHPLAPESVVVGLHDQWRGQYQLASGRHSVPRPDETEPASSDTNWRLRLGTGTNPLRADSDGDGLTDFAELRTTHTDPLQPDTDGDGKTDGFEAGLGTDPLSPDDWTVDADGDGLTALDEAIAGTNPALSDTDGDGVADGVELAQGSNPLDSSDGGAAPDPATLLAMPFRLFGDYAAWAMTVEGVVGDSRVLRLATPAPNIATETNLLLRRGATYRIRLDWLGSPGHNDPDWYCWEAKLGTPLQPSGRTFPDYDPCRLPGFEVLSGDNWFCENDDGLLTSHVHTMETDGGNIAAGKTAVLHLLDDPTIVKLDGCDSLNEATHHTALYETNALVVRRAQSFRFKTTVTKWFNPARHELRFLLADDFSGTWITNEITESTATEPTTEWFFRNIASSANPDESIELTTDVFCSTTNCPIGAYRFGAAIFNRSTGDRIDSKELAVDLIVLFNPWSDKDSVYMADETWRNECVLETLGKMWLGTRTHKIEKRWAFNQFSQAPLSVVLFHLSHLSRTSRANPVRIARLFSWIVNSKDNPSGIVRGNWGTVFPNGTKPWEWQGTLPIMETYLQNRTPVNYGQCFVFAGVLTSCMRCVGIPARPVTNYDSGHDKDKDGFVDQYMVSRTRMDRSRSDIIWNYHVWTECWMARTNESNGDDCWQILDGTPQEQSEGKYQCGPARRAAVKQQVAESYDTLFVVGEVSGQIRSWRMKNTNWILLKTSFGKYGREISTKNESGTRLDLTDKYKNP